jgi:futalosine hydrolase
MKILIVSATKLEIAPLIEILGMPQFEEKHLTSFKTKQHQIDVLITGIGMVFTTFHLSALLANHKYDCAINAGVAGAIDKNMVLGEIVNVVQDYFYELGAEDNDLWLNINDLNLLSTNDFPYSTEGLINNCFPALLLINDLKRVKGHTVNKVHGNLQSIKTMQDRSDAQIESMEGAAFLFCCLYHNLPCIQIRCISNFVELRNKANWKMKEAINNLNEFLKQMIVS